MEKRPFFLFFPSLVQVQLSFFQSNWWHLKHKIKLIWPLLSVILIPKHWNQFYQLPAQIKLIPLPPSFLRSGLVWTKRACDGERKMALILLLLFLFIFVTCLIYHSHMGSSLTRVIVRIKERNGLRKCIWSMLWQSDHPFSLCSRTNILVPVCHFVCRLLGLQHWSTSFVTATFHFLMVLHFLTFLPHFSLSCCPIEGKCGVALPTRAGFSVGYLLYHQSMLDTLVKGSTHSLLPLQTLPPLLSLSVHPSIAGCSSLPLALTLF